MSDTPIIHTLVAYHTASNRRLWEHIVEHLSDAQFTQELGFSHGSVRHQMVHLAATDRYWLHDIQALPVTGLNPDDYPTRQSLTPVFEEVQQALLDYVQALTTADLQETPDGLMLRRDEALAHVVNHGTDHRAQTLSMLHMLGAPTFEQDLPDFLRRYRPLSKTEVLRLIRYWRGRWEEALSSIPRRQMVEPAVGDWSVKDIVAHITWHDREMIGLLKARKLVGSPWWNLPLDQRNQNIFEQHRDLPLEDALREHDEAHRTLLDEIARLDDDDLNDPDRIGEMIPGYNLWMLLEENTWAHYLDHTEALWGWLASASSSPPDDAVGPPPGS
jgi:uncharacterized damage-inducible protein DinB